MSKKKKYQLFSIFLLLLGIILLFPYTNWGDKTSITGFFIVVLGTAGSILSIFIPNQYSSNFTKNEWKEINSDFYITVPYKKHGLGKTPQIQSFIKKSEDEFSSISLSENHDEQGNVTIKSHIRFNGKITLK